MATAAFATGGHRPDHLAGPQGGLAGGEDAGDRGGLALLFDGDRFGGDLEAEALGPLQVDLALVGGGVHARAEGEQDGVEIVAEFIEGAVHAEAPTELELRAEAFDQFDLGVEDGGGETFLGMDAQRAAGAVAGFEDDAIVAFLKEVEGGGESGGAGADDGDALAAGRFAEGRVGDADGQVGLGGDAVQRAHPDRFVHLLADAGRLAKAGADVAERGREGQAAADDLDGGGDVAARERFGEAGDVGFGGAAHGALGDAGAGVIGEDQLQGGLARGRDLGGCGGDDHAFGAEGGAGREEIVVALDLDHADEAGGARGEAGLVAEGGDRDAEARGGLEDRRPGFHVDGVAVNGQSHSVTVSEEVSVGRVMP